MRLAICDDNELERRILHSLLKKYFSEASISCEFTLYDRGTTLYYDIMDGMEYPGIRVTMNANVGRLITPLKIDISTGDVITPRAIEFNYDLLLEDRSIKLWSYNLETILAEKLQTVLARGILNTRMRDFYDIRMLVDTYEDKVNKAVLKDAFAATCKKRGTDNLQEQAEEIVKIIEADEQIQVLWRAYQKKYSYAAEIDYASVISGVRKLMDWIR